MTAPSLLLIVILAGGMLASLSVALLWRSKVALQLRLDRCVEGAALDLQRIQGSIEVSNRRMRAERAAAAASAIPSGGVSVKAAQAVLTAEMIGQELLRMKWRARQATWLARRGCDGRRDAFLPLPSLEWWRPPEDSLGPQPLEWKGPKRLSIRLWHSNRVAAARISHEAGTKWDAKWSK